MNCPEHGLVIRKYFQIWHHQSADVPRKYVTWGEVLNPLRYEIAFGRGPGRYWHLNNDAIWNRRLRNLTWRLWGKRRFERRLQKR